MSKSEKFEKAVKRASNAADAAINDAEESTLQSQMMNGSGITEDFDPAEFIREMVSGGYQMAERFVSLDEGKMIRGYLVGRGMTQVEAPDGQMREVERLRFQLATKDGACTGAVVSILSATQLDTAFAKIPADGSCLAIIAKGGKVQTGKKRMMDEYFVQTKYVPNSPAMSRQDWPSLPGVEQKMITSSMAVSSVPTEATEKVNG